MSKKKQIQCQIIYVTSQDKKDVAFVIVFFILKKLLVPVVPQDLEQNHEVREIGNNDDLLWTVFLEVKLSGT